jgi:hypothetical protein
MNRHALTQFTLNRSTRDGWESYAGHRRQMSDLIRAAASGRPKLCVLGAGNCNDLDLRLLLETSAEVHLVDIDEAALRQGVERQNVAGRPDLHVHADVDVTRCLHELATWSPQTVLSDADLERLVDAPAALAPALPGPFGLVVSSCLLSQLVAAVDDGLGASHLRFVNAVQAIRLGHLRLMMQLTAPGGIALLCTDLVSSETAPEIMSMPPADLARTCVQLIERQNFFHGVNPAVLQSVIRHDPVLQAQIAKAQFCTPWLWHSTQRSYAVYALIIRKRP